MDLFKKTAVIFIITSGLIGSYFIIKNSGIDNSEIAAEIKNIVKKGDETFLKNPIKWLKESASPSAIGISEENFTENLGEIVFEQIKSSNGIDLASGKTINVNDIFKNKQLELNFIFDISIAELKISQDNSIEAKKIYLQKIEEANKNNLGDFKKIHLEVIVDVFQKLDVSSAKKISGIYKNLADDYLNIAAPEGWIDFHKAAIINFKNSSMVYSAMSNYLNDPLMGYLALESIEFVSDQSQQVQNILNKHLKEIE